MIKIGWNREDVNADYLRYLVIGLIALVVVVSGCTDSSTSPDPTETGESPQQSDEASSDNPSQESVDDSEPADISLKSLSVPEEVEMGETFTVEATFENTGGESGQFETTVMMREQDSESFSATESTLGGELEPGEEDTYETTLTAKGVSANVIGLAGTEAESNLRIVPKKIQMGEEYTTSNNIGITVSSVNLEDYYTYEGYMGEESIKEPESGQYVFVNLRTQNQGDIPKSHPSTIDFQLIANNRQYETTYLVYDPIDKGDPYEGGEVQPSIVREGYMVFEVPDEVNQEDISVVWNEVISLTEKSVYWTT